MPYTYIPSGVMLIIYGLTLVFSLVSGVFTSEKVIKFLRLKKGEKIKTKVLVVLSLLSGITLLLVFAIHMMGSGLYHDENGTGPSDAETNFNLMTIAISISMFSFTNTFLNKYDMFKN